MARLLYGNTPADFTLSRSGKIVPDAPLTVWTALEGGSQVTDLLDYGNAPVSTITSDDTGLVRFYAPDGTDATLWIQADSGGTRLAVRPVNLPRPDLEIGTVTTGTADVTLTPNGLEGYTMDLVLPSAGANGVNTAAIQDAAVTAAKLATSGRFDFPAGASGGYGFASGAVHLSGTGSPEGVVTAAPGSTWLQTDSTTDVKGWIRWVKATGTGKTGWVAGPEADTGWRSLLVWTSTDTFSVGTTPDTTTFTYEGAGQINIRRVSGQVHLRLASGNIKMAAGSSSSSSGALVHLPSGFQAAATTGLQLLAGGFAFQSSTTVARQANTSLPSAGFYMPGNATLTWPTSDPWPSSLPGTAA